MVAIGAAGGDFAVEGTPFELVVADPEFGGAFGFGDADVFDLEAAVGDGVGEPAASVVGEDGVGLDGDDGTAAAEIEGGILADMHADVEYQRGIHGASPRRWGRV